MKPVTVTIDVSQSPEEVFDFLDLLANHESFNHELMRDWKLEGPATGVGARAHVNVVLGGRTQPLDIEVIESERPTRNVERNVGANGKRTATGSYMLAPLPTGGTRITFEYAVQQAPLSERLSAPIVHRMMAAALEQAMANLAAELLARSNPT